MSITKIVFVGLAVASAGCATGSGGGAPKPREPNELERRAAFDLGCKWDQLEWTKISDNTWGVRGCSRQATYVSACDGYYGLNCKWILNGLVQTAPSVERDPLAPALAR